MLWRVVSGNLCPVTFLATVASFTLTYVASRKNDPMDTSLSFLPVNPAVPSVNDSTGSAPSPAQPVTGEEFSALLTGHMLKAERQIVAAQTLTGTGLQVLPLGSKLKLITSDGPLPDMASLAAFARTQGIDESAVQALFGDAKDSALLTPPGAGTAGFFNEVPRAKSQPKDLITTMTVDQFSPGNPQWQIPIQSAATATATTTADVAAVGISAAMLAGRNMAAWMPLKASPLIDASEKTNTDNVSSETAVQDAMRLTISSPTQAVTQRLTQMSGPSEQSTWVTLLAGSKLQSSSPTAAKAWETLQLDIPNDLLIDLFDGPQDSLVDNSLASSGSQASGHAMAGTSPGQSGPAASTPPNLSAQAEQRVIQQQQLADKLGQALAQRFVDQIEKGQWKIEMRLQPESLGRIDVELKMHAGGLDALFSAENAVTRELIAQGSGKLKEALTQAGMTVADVWVGGEQSRQSGGNSTPKNSLKPAFEVAGRKSDSVEGVAATVKDEPAATDGLNVWA